ncbi:DUF3105 domain-containing protein [Skermania piniformis]|uniref:DUF3105 domain-containing protein n=1 Tax=Skermania pinensis TaxID=39122 RepID=A0ABX8SA70_9ACTN|nr:DUF3105 domain-containing protein [Skermania piniformis]QXQ14744.1 DUF3105 domain-containing protein [Skermania piniformis]
MPTESDTPRNSTSAKSAKAIKAASKGKKKRSSDGGGLPTRRAIPWVTIGAVLVILAFIGALAYNLVPKYEDKAEADRFTPSESNQDPSSAIDGVVKIDYPAGLHVKPDQRVAYDHSPPFGGPHDGVWASCMGNVYPKPVRTENMVHALEHGAVWVAYNPDKLDAAGIDALKDRVDGQQYMLMSPYPGLDRPIALQSWGHQLEVDDPTDPRIKQFIVALRQNKYTYPEVGASCSTIPGSFDPDNPPAFDPNPPGPDAVPMDGKGLTPDSSEIAGGGMAGIPGLPGGLGELPGGAPAAPVQPAPESPAPAAPTAPAGNG